MRIASLVLSSLILLVIFTQCKKDPTAIPTPVYNCNNPTRSIDSAKKWIIGKWDWVEEKRAVRGSGFRYLTPATEGYNFGYHFSHDTAFSTYNGVISDTTKYRFGLFSDFTLMPEDSLPVIAFFDITTGARTDFVPYIICKDTLLLEFGYVRTNQGVYKFRKIP